MSLSVGVGVVGLWLVLTMSAASARAEASPPVARYAIVIGNNRAEDDRTENLHYADDDAIATHQLLLQAGVHSVLFTQIDPDTRRLYPDVLPAGPPRAATLEAAIREVFGRMRAEVDRGTTTELMFFYSGHGDVAGGEGYVLLEDTRLTRTDLHRWLSRSPAARNHVFIDACRSFFLLFARKAGGRRVARVAPLVLDAGVDDLANVGYILSTSADRESYEWDAVQGGILSHELRSALRGGADADLDGRVTYGELGAFLRTANEKIVNPTFRPEFLIRPPAGDLDREVLRWRAQDRAVRASLGAVGHVFVEDAHGVRLLDVHPSVTQPLSLHLPAQRPLFVCQQGGRREYALAATELVSADALRQPPAGEATRSKGTTREGVALSELFEVPFDGAAVASFQHHEHAEETAARTARREWQRRHRFTLIAGAAAVATAAAGVTLSALALRAYLAGADASQVERDRLNRDILRFSVGAIAGYAVATAAGLTWAKLKSNETDAYSVGVSADPGDRAMAFSISRAF